MDVGQAARIRYSAMLGIDTPLPAASYLRALDATGLGVRVLSLLGGMVDLKQLNAHAVAPWAHVGLFTAPVAERYVNIVAAPPGLMLGDAMRAVDMRVPFGKTSHPNPHPIADKNEVVYTPQTALAGRYTVGVPNVAITCAPTADAELAPHERAALAQYSAVITHTQEHAIALEKAGVPVALLHPGRDDAARTLRVLLEQLLERHPITGDGLGSFPNF